MTSHASNKRPAASEAAPVDLTASDDPSDHHEPERLRPTKDVANPYKKSKKLSTTTVPASSAQASTPASTPAASVGRPSVVADLTLPETGSDEEPPEMLEPEAVPETQKKKPNEKKPAAASASASASEKKRESRKTAGNSKSADGEIPGPIRPRKVPPLRSNPFDRTGPRWSTYEGKLLVRTAPPVSKPKPTDPPTKVAAFDMDGTILLTLGVRHASNFGDLQLWSSTVLEKIRSLHDEGYRLVLITNQGGIQTQLDGKKATFIRSVIDWLAHEVDRPFNAVASCSKTNGFHKPLAGMWSIAEQKFNGGAEFDLSQSFYVGDSIPGDSQVSTIV
jgi:HAD superfamily hydrolase (TIGR01662 family)